MTSRPIHASADWSARYLIAVIVVVVWGLITHGTFAGSGDEPHYLMIAHSIAFDLDVDLANDYAQATLIGGGTLQPGAHARWRNGQLRPVHDIGMPLVFAPIVGVAYVAADRLGDMLPAAVLSATRLNKSLLLRHAISLVMALLTGLLARELFLVLRGSASDWRRPFLWSAAFALSPPVLSHSFLFFTEIPTALIAFALARRLVSDSRMPARFVFVLGLLTGFLVLVHARNVGLAAGFVCVALLARRRVTTAFALMPYLGGLVAALAARTLTTYVLWDTIMTTPLAILGQPQSPPAMLREMFARLTAMLFDREYGLLAYAPVYLLALPGVVLMARRRDRLQRAGLLLTLTYLLPVLLPLTNPYGIGGGWSPAARFLVPIAPFLWLAVYEAVRERRRARYIVKVLLGLQLVVDAYVWQFPRTLWNDGDGVTAFPLSRWLPTWSTGSYAITFLALTALSVAFACLFVATSGPSTNRPATTAGT